MSTNKTTAKVQASTDAAGELKPAEKKMLYSVLTHIRGQVNFKKVADDIEVPNAEAARKRLKRFLEKECVATTVKGDRIGEDEEEVTGSGATKAPAKTPRKAKTAPPGGDPTQSETAGKKRKVAEMEEEQTVKATDQATFAQANGAAE